MTSLDLEENSKAHGGDEFYVSYKLDNAAEPDHSPDAIARVVDRADGTYELYFLQSRSPRRNPSPPVVGRRKVDHSTFVYVCKFVPGSPRKDLLEVRWIY